MTETPFRPDDVMLPCGCYLRHTIVDGVNTLTIVACRADCPNLVNALELAEAADRPVERRVGP